jgi:hypothetical protein
MPEYTEHERTQLHAKARQQIRFVRLAPTLEAANNRRFLALGYLLCLAEAEVFSRDSLDFLHQELSEVTRVQIGELTAAVLRDTLAPEVR